mmetsp:Transcript_54435/g.121899  ORF Transcript_54435/g.121899 Transcript_54435/m.121899 type:complete len:283 (-) Transcript_54435:266-1114(-)
MNFCPGRLARCVLRAPAVAAIAVTATTVAAAEDVVLAACAALAASSAAALRRAVSSHAADTSSIAWLLHGLSVAMTARGHTTLTPSVMASASSCMPVSVIMLDRKSHLRAGSVKSCALHTISARCASLTRVAFQIQDRSETKLIGGVRRFATATKDCTEWSRASGAVCASQWTPVRCTNPSTRRAGMAPALNTSASARRPESAIALPSRRSVAHTRRASCSRTADTSFSIPALPMELFMRLSSTSSCSRRSSPRPLASMASPASSIPFLARERERRRRKAWP